MALLIRWLFRLVTGLVALALVALALAYFFLSRSLPAYDRELTVAGLSAPVEIVRNNANVPHILGQSDPDSFFGLGYVHAQDRLWQMMLQRRTVQGRLSEVFGARALRIDSLMRRFDFHTLAQQSVAAQDAYTQAALQAYADGVNARLAEINDGALGRGAPEMFVFNMPIAPWQPADSIAIIKLMSMELAAHLDEEVLYARTALTLDDPVRLNDLMSVPPGEGIAALPRYAALFPGGRAPVQTVRRETLARDPLSPFHHRPLAGASNAWAAAPSRSAAGGTLLANDPHLGLSAPSIWYLARIELETGGVIGGTIPGIPAVLVGRSARLGWGLTSAYLDDQDLFLEELNPEDPGTYRTPDGFKPFRSRETIVPIKDDAPVTLTLRWTDNGPVLPPSFNDLDQITPPGHVVSLGWTALQADDTTMTAAMRLHRAGTVEDAIAATDIYMAPAMNLTVVDQDRIALTTIC